MESTWNDHAALLVPWLSVLAGLYIISSYVYSIYFSPLSSIPGPKIAAATRLYEFYYDAVKVGRFWVELERLHKQYGPIVRISPYEVHIDDPAFFNTLYNVTKKLDKYPWYYSWLDRNGSIFATTDADQHKIRSSVIKKSLSTTSVSKVEPVLQRHFANFNKRMQEAAEKGVKVPLSDIWRAIAVDVVTDLSLPESYNLMDKPDFGVHHSEFIRGITEFSLWNRYLIYLVPILQTLPRWVVALQGEAAVNVVDSVNQQKDQVRRVITNDGKPISSKSHPVIMNEIYKSKELPASDKSVKRLLDEVAILVGAGSETTAHALSMIAYHVIANPPIYDKLKQEIRESFSSDEIDGVLSYKRLEGLPYLNACVHEGLRLATSVSGRLPRVNRSQVTTYTDPNTSKTYIIPVGTPVSMTIRDMHYSPALFPDPEKFDPERWLGDNKAASEKWFAVFGRGARGCVGRHLAMAELQMSIANLLGRFDVRLAEGTSLRDVEMWHDCFSPFPVKDNNGMLVEIKPR